MKTAGVSMVTPFTSPPKPPLAYLGTNTLRYPDSEKRCLRGAKTNNRFFLKAWHRSFQTKGLLPRSSVRLFAGDECIIRGQRLSNTPKAHLFHPLVSATVAGFDLEIEREIRIVLTK